MSCSQTKCPWETRFLTCQNKKPSTAWGTDKSLPDFTNMKGFMKSANGDFSTQKVSPLLTVSNRLSWSDILSNVSMVVGKT